MSRSPHAVSWVAEMPNEQQYYLAHLNALRQDANSPSAATVRSLDDLIDRFPSLAPAEDSPILGRRPSLSPEDPLAAEIGKFSRSVYYSASSSFKCVDGHWVEPI